MAVRKTLLIDKSKGEPCFLFIYDSVKSTNVLARRRTSKYDNFAILARKQTAGKGRFDRKFLSLKDKGIYLTICFKTEKDLKKISQYSAYIAIATKRVLERNGSRVIKFKWPNDLQIENKKCAGILCESIVREKKRFVIIGIGINLFYKQEEFGDLTEIATSVFSSNEINKKKRLLKITEEIVEEFHKVCKELAYDIYGEYVDACDIVGKTVEHLGRLGEVVSIEQDMSINVNFLGEIKNVNYGEIIVQGKH